MPASPARVMEPQGFLDAWGEQADLNHDTQLHAICSSVAAGMGAAHRAGPRPPAT